MIVFVDDEKWAVSGYLDEFENKSDRDSRYDCKFFFYPSDAKVCISENAKKIKLIILDLMLLYAPDAKPTEKAEDEKLSGGEKFLKEIRKDPSYDNIPILLYTVKSEENINIKDFQKFKEDNKIYYLGRNCNDEEFYSRVDELLNLKFQTK